MGIAKLLGWFYTANTDSIQVPVPKHVLHKIRDLQSRSDHEWVGHFDIDRSGAIESIAFSQGMSVPEVSRDFEVSWHTHPTRYDDAFPDWPSRQDMLHVLATVGILREVHTHMVFTPRAIYAIGVGDRLRERLRVDTRGSSVTAALEGSIDTAYATAFANITPDNQLTSSGSAARVEWIRQLVTLGFEVEVWSSPARSAPGTVYDTPILLQVVPKELSVARVLLAGVALASALFAGRQAISISPPAVP